ncbi:MAG TPA: metallophosphoesterase [Pyrinomonadaceae bacterium]|jgi:Icc-related predicted phosphoesterase
MNKIAWTTDIHLDRLSERDYLEYKEYLLELNPDCLLISGDIAEGEFVYEALRDFDGSLGFPVYFVLGNHDFYFGGFAGVEKRVGALVEESSNLHWLSESGIVKINESTALIGIEGWGDAGNGALNLSAGFSRDVLSIADYKNLTREEIAGLMKTRGARYAEKLRPVLLEAVENYQKVILVTHVPPFVEVCFDRNLRIIDEFKQPFYTCKAIGDLLLEVMPKHPECRMTVLCGHLHEKADQNILENLRVRVKESGYGTWWDATLIDLEKV